MHATLALSGSDLATGLHSADLRAKVMTLVVIPSILGHGTGARWGSVHAVGEALYGRIMKDISDVGGESVKGSVWVKLE